NFAEALAGFTAVGDRWGIAQVLDGLSQLAAQRGDWKRALGLADDAIAEMAQLDAVDEIAEFSCRRAELLLRGGVVEAAGAEFGRAEELARRIGVPATLAMAHHGLGRVAQSRHEHTEARRRFRLALDVRGPGWQSLGVRCLVLVSLALLDGDGERAAYLLGVA